MFQLENLPEYRKSSMRTCRVSLRWVLNQQLRALLLILFFCSYSLKIKYRLYTFIKIPR